MEYGQTQEKRMQRITPTIVSKHLNATGAKRTKQSSRQTTEFELLRHLHHKKRKRNPRANWQLGFKNEREKINKEITNSKFELDQPKIIWKWSWNEIGSRIDKEKNNKALS